MLENIFCGRKYYVVYAQSFFLQGQAIVNIMFLTHIGSLRRKKMPAFGYVFFIISFLVSKIKIRGIIQLRNIWWYAQDPLTTLLSPGRIASQVLVVPKKLLFSSQE